MSYSPKFESEINILFRAILNKESIFHQQPEKYVSQNLFISINFNNKF